jgi:hypothetical protein
MIRYPLYWRVEGPKDDLVQCGKFDLAGIRFPDRPARSKLLYRLCCFNALIIIIIIIIIIIFQRHLKIREQSIYKEFSKLRNYRKQPYWALHTYFGKW